MTTKRKLHHIENFLGMWGIMGMVIAFDQETYAGGFMALIAMLVSAYIKPLDD